MKLKGKVKKNIQVRIEGTALQSIKDFLAVKGSQGPVRIELCFTGCCDPSLGLRIDTATEADLVHEEEGVTFIISMETYELAGDITISSRDDAGKKCFVVTSSKPISEWDGFGACEIKV